MQKSLLEIKELENLSEDEFYRETYAHFPQEKVYFYNYQKWWPLSKARKFVKSFEEKKKE